MNAMYARERAEAAEALAAALATPAQVAEFAAAAEVLHTATRAWKSIPPATPAEIDAVSTQLLGMSRSLAEIRHRWK